YHGPTSALFDENPPNPDDDDEARVPQDLDVASSPTLVAETAKQRHFEAINRARGRLDFDGVDSETGSSLLDLYWSRQLHAGLIVYRSAFMRDMACDGPYFSKLLLNAMYYSVSKHSKSDTIRKDQGDISTAGWMFRQRFIELLRDEFDKSKITTIQALLIMASSLFTRCDERSTSWLYAGNAFNMIIDLGLHVKRPNDTSASPVDEEIERRVYWAAYMIDKIQCLYQGRQPCIRRSESNVPLVFGDDFEEYENFEPAAFSDDWPFGAVPSHNVTLMVKYSQICMIMERVQHDVYAVQQGVHAASLKYASRLKSDLEAWRQSLPKELDYRDTDEADVQLLPYNLSLLGLYNVLMILIHRPLLSKRRSLQLHADVAQAALNTCVAAAEEITYILRLYAARYRLTSSTFSLSYAAYISAQVHARALAIDTSRSSAGSLEFCLSALDQHEIIYSASKRANTIIRHLIGRPRIDGLGSTAPATLAEATGETLLGTEADNMPPNNASAGATTSQYPDDPGSTWVSTMVVAPCGAMTDLNLQPMAENDDQWHYLLDGPIFHDIYANDRMMIDGAAYDFGNAS
ncbi:fungal-specific transcription factor domain-containing protein, partial [Plectosphaerella plurivora]